MHYKFKNPRGNQTVTIKEFTVLSQAHALPKDRAAFDIVIDHPTANEPKMRSKDDFDPDLVANDLAKSLRWSQNQVLLACAVVLRDYAAREDDSN